MGRTQAGRRTMAGDCAERHDVPTHQFVKVSWSVARDPGPRPAPAAVCLLHLEPEGPRHLPAFRQSMLGGGQTGYLRAARSLLKRNGMRAERLSAMRAAIFAAMASV